MCNHEIYLNILIAINVGLILGFIIRCYRDKEFKELAKKLYKRTSMGMQVEYKDKEKR